MVAGRPKLGTFLIENGLVTLDQLNVAVEHQVATGGRLGEVLIALGYCTDASIAQALAMQLEVPFVDLDEDPPSPTCVALIPPDIALEYGVLPIRMEGNRLLVVARDPYDIRVDEVIRQATNLHAILAVAPRAQLRDRLEQLYSESLVEEADAHSREDLLGGDGEDPQLSVEKLVAAGEKVSTIQVVNAMIADAVRRGASDLHLEPELRGIRVRYRVDGRMCARLTLPTEFLQSVVARIKIMCGMDISETRKPQDGGCSLRVDGRPIELRASTLRGVHGEIVVLRILSADAGLHQLDALGFQAEMHRDFRRLLAARNGLLLITGPTGSGKSTSLYAALNHLNREEVNILTVEDPVESKLIGINQIQVHDRAGRSFASTLRAVLRQDPDIIMVGEIRDLETAEIAARSALTGHLVLSTLHTQHTLGAITRLVEMGIQPWLLASCLNGVLTQRLARRVCEECAVDYAPPAELQRALISQFGSLDGARFRKGTGCAKCHRTGSRGRVGIYELLVIEEEMRHTLARGSEIEHLSEHAVARGLQRLEHDAFRKACLGVIAPEEIILLGMGVAMAMEDAAAEAPPAPEPPAYPSPMRKPAAQPHGPRR